MKRLIILVVVKMIIFSLQLFSETSVNGDEIISAINRIQPVRYENAIIKGNLNFIEVQEKKTVSSSVSETKEYHCSVRVPVVFIDCTFTGDVSAYFNDETKDEMFAVMFYETVVFENCTFKRDALFKYSEFHKNTNFPNNRFEGDALFKYSEFNTSVSFENCSFYEGANFKYAKFAQESIFSYSIFYDLANLKYTKFKDFTDFSMVNFKDEVDFKYTKFPEGVTFKNTVFTDYANFKYAHFSEPFNMKGAEFGGDTNFKYTKLEGRDFSEDRTKYSEAY